MRKAYPNQIPRYCPECEERVLDVFTSDESWHCPMCGGEPNVDMLGANHGNA